jgi:hypothetical protein
MLGIAPPPVSWIKNAATRRDHPINMRPILSPHSSVGRLYNLHPNANWLIQVDQAHKPMVRILHYRVPKRHIRGGNR